MTQRRDPELFPQPREGVKKRELTQEERANLIQNAGEKLAHFLRGKLKRGTESIGKLKISEEFLILALGIEGLPTDILDEVVKSTPGMGKEGDSYIITNPDLLMAEFGPKVLENKVFNLFTANPDTEHTLEQVATEIGGDPSGIRKVIKSLLDAGRICKSGTVKNKAGRFSDCFKFNKLT